MKKPYAATTQSSSSSSSSSSSVRSILFTSRPQQAQVHPMSSPNPKDKDLGSSHDHALDAFQRSVAERLASLANASEKDDAALLSLAWVRLAMDAVLGCEADFRSLVPRPWGRAPPLSKAEERIADDMLERSVKALDLCNAIRDGIDHVRRWQRHVEILLCALDLRQRCPLGEAQLRRARKALADLILAIGEENPAAAVLAQYRHRSFGRPYSSSSSSSSSSSNATPHFRSLSWSVSRSWSAGRQLQVMGSNLVPPKSASAVDSANGFAVPAYTMNVIILFAMWVLVAAIPCQDRGLQAHFSIPRNSFPWAAPLLSIYDRVMEESRHQHRRGGAAALLKEISEISACVRRVSDLLDSCSVFPLTENQDREIRKEVLGLMQLWVAMKEGVDPLEKQVRELFHRIVSTRTEVLDCLSRNNSSDR